MSRNRKNEAGPVKPGPAGFLYTERLPLLIAACCAFLVFLPALHSQFVTWDDDWNFLNNPYFRGLGPEQLAWMFTTFLGGPYQPLTWLSFGFDYSLWGMDPFYYHLTNLLLHTLNAGLFYAAALRLLRLAQPEGENNRLRAGALFAALVFAVHPLRVESVAWVTERRDVLSGTFYLAALLAYLKAARPGGEQNALKRLGPALGFYCAALLSKAIGVCFAFLLLALDIYPLRRLGPSVKTWLSPEARPVLKEKMYFLAPAFLAGLAGLYGQYKSTAAIPLAEFGWAQRLAQTAYGSVFYLRKTLVPTGLMPLYEVPASFDPLSRPFVLSALAALALAVIVYTQRRRWPGLALAAVAYLAFLAPVLGLVKMGSHFAADRYSYLACGGLALLAGWALARAMGSKGIFKTFGVPAAFLVVLLMGRLTWQQTLHWKDSETLWNYVVPLAPESGLAINNLGDVYFGQGRYQEAAAAYTRSVALKPNFAFIRYNLANTYTKMNRWDLAEAEYKETLRLAPAFSVARGNYGNLLTDSGRYAEAEAQYLEAIKLDPGYADAYYGLGDVYLYQNRPADARPNYEKALSMNPQLSGAAANLALALYKLRDAVGSERWFNEALRMKPGLAAVHDNYGNLLLDTGRYNEAVAQYGEALRLNPGRAESYNNIGAALLRQGRAAEALPYFGKALEINPRLEMARRSLATARAQAGR